MAIIVWARGNITNCWKVTKDSGLML